MGANLCAHSVNVLRRAHCQCKDRMVTADANGGPFRLNYVDGMIEPYEVYAFNALYSFVLRGKLRNRCLI